MRNRFFASGYLTQKNTVMKILNLIPVLMILFSCKVHAQSGNDSSNMKNNRLDLFIDGSEYIAYIKQQLTFVDYVRDRHLADVHLLITTQNTGSGGTEYSLVYWGQKKFEGKNDTLKYVANTNNTEEETRKGLVQILKMGLMSYVAQLPGADAFEISFNSPTDSSLLLMDTTDKWNSWIFTVYANSYFNGEQSYQNFYLNGGLTANKTTEDWKINFTVNGSYNYTKYAYDDFVYSSETQSRSADLLIVKSLTDHWSAGGAASVYSSTYSNYDLKASISPAIEWNLYPYSKSTSHLFTMLYTLTPSYSNYTDSTLYNKTEELLLSQSFTASLDLIEKWGSINMSVYGSNYFHDFSKNSLYVSSSLNLRIVKGLELSLYGNLGLVHDQLNLSKEGATPEEVLTRQHELSTNFSYYGSIGISYNFGSTYNNVVNARFNFLN
ncbi:MAG: hypothetical protein IPO83_02185 [Chitinophagaceae bacterium]|nr:hypothetical protein [Chitinophagaceae bacterium]